MLRLRVGGLNFGLRTSGMSQGSYRAGYDLGILAVVHSLRA